MKRYKAESLFNPVVSKRYNVAICLAVGLLTVMTIALAFFLELFWFDIDLNLALVSFLTLLALSAASLVSFSMYAILSFKDRQWSQAFKKHRELLQTMLHDLSNPLTGMMLVQSLLENELQKPQWHRERVVEWVNRVGGAGKFFATVIGYAKPYEALMAGDYKTHPGPTDIHSVLSEVMAGFGARIENKQLRVESLNSVPADCCAYADRSALEVLVLSTLIDNAITYSQPNKTLSMHSFLEGEWIVIQIEDQGIGMSPADVEQMLRPGASAGRRGTKNERGTGLGVPVAQRVLESFGGELHIRSRCIEDHPQKHGTTVRVLLRRDQAYHADTTAKKAG